MASTHTYYIQSTNLHVTLHTSFVLHEEAHVSGSVMIRIQKTKACEKGNKNTRKLYEDENLVIHLSQPNAKENPDFIFFYFSYFVSSYLCISFFGYLKGKKKMSR